MDKHLFSLISTTGSTGVDQENGIFLSLTSPVSKPYWDC